MLKRALISVYDKTGIVKFARELNNLGIEIVSTGGTANLLQKYEIPVRPVSDVTKFPEILNGRVKTQHPSILGGILALREKEEHVKELEKHDIKPIDIVVFNFYPFEEIIKKENADLKEILENIDIGGPSTIRAAAKNFENVVVIVNPDRYKRVIEEIKKKGDVSKETRSMLAVEAFKRTAKYDWMIQNFFEKRLNYFTSFPDAINLEYKKIMNLRYGENPHQRAALYKHMTTNETTVINSEQLSGKKLSWTNILDLNTALELVKEFEESTVTIIKHTSPCGAACGSTLFDAYEKAYASDPISAYGGIVGVNRNVDLDTAKRMSTAHFDCIIAPDFDDAALEVLKQRKALRLLKTGPFSEVKRNHIDMAKVAGGLMIQEHNVAEVNDLKVVTEVKPTPEQLDSLLFAWKVVKYVKSNGIVLVKGRRTVGIGLGQTSRVDAARNAIARAGQEADASLMASDGFLPFRDTVDEAAKVGIKAIIQPGGSKRDPEVIDAANEHRIPMVFTGIRAFRH